MVDLIDPIQQQQIRTALHDVADTFAFPITIVKTTYVNAAFAEPPTIVKIPTFAIRDYISGGRSGEQDQYRNDSGPDQTHEFDLYIGWHLVEQDGLVDADNKILLDHNDIVEMEGETYEIVSFGGTAQMTHRPTFLQIGVRRKFQSPNGAAPLEEAP